MAFRSRGWSASAENAANTEWKATDYGEPLAALRRVLGGENPTMRNRKGAAGSRQPPLWK